MRRCGRLVTAAEIIGGGIGCPALPPPTSCLLNYCLLPDRLRTCFACPHVGASLKLAGVVPVAGIMGEVVAASLAQSSQLDQVTADLTRVDTGKGRGVS